MATLVGAKGQVTIEKQFRDRLGVEPGWRAIQRLEGDRLVLEFRPPKHDRSLYGVLASKAKRTFATAEELDAAIEEGWCLTVQDAANEEAQG
jgi:bifunctional DNA-binding transcriptional regulator/antitoxin component of YhaV-PrlF toxin-antitoxin module